MDMLQVISYLSLVIITVLESVYSRFPYNFIKKGFLQDVLWMIFYTYIFPLVIVVDLQNIFKQAGIIFYNLNGLSFELQLFGVIIISDFLRFLVHTSSHRFKFLWELHKLHHSTKELTAISGYRGSWPEEIIFSLLVIAPFGLLNIDSMVLVYTSLLNSIYGYFLHSNLKLRGKIFDKIICLPHFHSWHHSMELKFGYGQNFGVLFPWWDILFRTAFYSDSHPKEYGFREEKDYPQSFVSRLLYPFSKMFRRI